MFDDPFCQFPTLSIDFLERSTKLFFFERWGSFWEKKSSFEHRSVFQWISELERKRFRFSAKNLARMPNFCSGSPEKHFEENNVVQKKVLSSFSFFERQTLGRCPKNFWLRSLNCILEVQKVFFHHISWCSMTHLVRFRLFAEIFWKVFRNSFLWALRIVLTEEKFFRTKKCF